MFCSSFDQFGSYTSASPSQDFMPSAFRITSTWKVSESPRHLINYDFSDYKSLDAEDCIFIPGFCCNDQLPLHCVTSRPRAKASSNNQDSLTHFRYNDTGSVDSCSSREFSSSWQGRPIQTSIDNSKLAGTGNKPRTDVSANDSNRKECILDLPNWHPGHSNRSRSCPTFSSFQLLAPKKSNIVATGHVRLEPGHIEQQIRDEQRRIAQQYGPGRFQPFLPSRVVLEQKAQSSSGFQALLAEHSSCTQAEDQQTPYCELAEEPYFSGSNIPEEENCAIWIMGIPAQATYADLLGAVRGGKVFACLINPPTGDFLTSAAKLVFFTRSAAADFIERQSSRGIFVLGHRIRATWNRILYPACPHPHHSRVVVITGPAHMMSFEYFENFFKERFQYDLDSRFESVSLIPGYKQHVWKFASLRAQAELAKIAIERELSGIFEVRYGMDPCANPWC